MRVTAEMVVLVLAFLAIQYAEAVEATTADRGGGLDHRVEQRV